MKFLIVDDEELAVNKIERLLSDLSYGDITSTTSAVEAVEICRSYQFDVVFLDINMPEKSGLEVAEEISAINPKSYIVFVTAYDNYAIESYKLGAIDYLLKPVTSSSLQATLNRVMKYISSSPSRPPQKDIIIKAKYQDKIALLKLDEIYYFEAKLNDTIARTKDGEYFTHKKISDLELLLEDTNFVKVHRSHLVNMTKISYVETIEKGKYRIYFQDINDIIYTSRAGAQELRNIFDYMI